MSSKSWRVGLLIALLILVACLVAQWLEPSRTALIPLAPSQVLPIAHDVRSYFPALKGMAYHFAGEGMEYAAFTRQITFANPESVQIEDASGTNLARVVEYSAEELKVVWSEEEFYEGHSLLDAVPRSARTTGRRDNLVLLRAPVEKGTSWIDERFQREIVSVDQVITVPLGTFYAVVVVKSKSLETDNSVQYEYYAKNMGLIKRESLYVQDGETYAVVSALRDLTSQRR